jgi:hypothetical protein
MFTAENSNREWSSFQVAEQVPLPGQAHALLDEIGMAAKAEKSEWMFPQTANPRRPISESRMLQWWGEFLDDYEAVGKML